MSADNKTTKDTIINFMTTGTLVQTLASCHTDARFTHIILDEVHGRDIFTDMLLLQLKLLLQENWDWGIKIILLSATMNMEKFTGYFNSNDSVQVGCLEIPSTEKIYPISTYYIDDLENTTPEGIMVNSLMDFHPEFDKKNHNYENVKYLIDGLEVLETTQNSNKKGGVLVFLPGIGEISMVGDILRSFSKDNNKQWIVIDMHSNQPDAEQRQAFHEVGINDRKIVLATNIAESSITVPDIKYVIDFCLTKYMKFDTYTTFSGLSLELASHHQCDQRKGRTGRTESGYCFRLVHKSFYETQMEVESLSEMQTCGLSLAFLHLKRLKMGTPSYLFNLAIDPPNRELIRASVQHLKECGALTTFNKYGEYQEDDGDITIIGEIATALPCDPKAARLIAFGHIFGFLNESVVIGMALSSKNLFASFNSNATGGIDAFVQKMELGGGLKSDAIAYLAAYHEFLKCKALAKNEENGNTRSIRMIMRERNIRSTVVQNLESTINRAVRKIHNIFRIHPTHFELISIEELTSTSSPCLGKLQILLAAASYPNIFYRPVQRNQNGYIKGVEREIGVGRNPKTSFYLKPAPRETFAKPPSVSQVEEIREKLTFAKDLKKPTVDWLSNTKYLIVDYSNAANEQDKWMGRVMKNVYRGLKFKGMNRPLSWKLAQGQDGYKDGKVMLDGPLSPIAIKFNCYFKSYNSSLSKYMFRLDVDRESVNLYCLDEQYPNPSSYTMSSLLLTQPKSKLIAKESTVLMGQTQGIFTLLHVLLAPHMNLLAKVQTGRKDAYYKEAIVGLGEIEIDAGRNCENNEDDHKDIENKKETMEQNQGTIIRLFEAHDSHIPFDIPVTRSVIQNANVLRMLIDMNLEKRNFISQTIESYKMRIRLTNLLQSFLQNPNQELSLQQSVSILETQDTRLFPAHSDEAA